MATLASVSSYRLQDVQQSDYDTDIGRSEYERDEEYSDAESVGWQSAISGAPSLPQAGEGSPPSAKNLHPASQLEPLGDGKRLRSISAEDVAAAAPAAPEWDGPDVAAPEGASFSMGAAAATTPGRPGRRGARHLGAAATAATAKAGGAPAPALDSFSSAPASGQQAAAGLAMAAAAAAARAQLAAADTADTASRDQLGLLSQDSWDWTDNPSPPLLRSASSPIDRGNGGSRRRWGPLGVLSSFMSRSRKSGQDAAEAAAVQQLAEEIVAAVVRRQHVAAVVAAAIANVIALHDPAAASAPAAAAALLVQSAGSISDPPSLDGAHYETHDVPATPPVSREGSQRADIGNGIAAATAAVVPSDTPATPAISRSSSQLPDDTRASNNLNSIPEHAAAGGAAAAAAAVAAVAVAAQLDSAGGGAARSGRSVPMTPHNSLSAMSSLPESVASDGTPAPRALTGSRSGSAGSGGALSFAAMGGPTPANTPASSIPVSQAASGTQTPLALEGAPVADGPVAAGVDSEQLRDVLLAGAAGEEVTGGLQGIPEESGADAQNGGAAIPAEQPPLARHSLARAHDAMVESVPLDEEALREEALHAHGHAGGRSRSRSRSPSPMRAHPLLRLSSSSTASGVSETTRSSSALHTARVSADIGAAPAEHDALLRSISSPTTVAGGAAPPKLAGAQVGVPIVAMGQPKAAAGGQLPDAVSVGQADQTALEPAALQPVPSGSLQYVPHAAATEPANEWKAPVASAALPSGGRAGAVADDGPLKPVGKPDPSVTAGSPAPALLPERKQSWAERLGFSCFTACATRDDAM